LFYQNYDEVHGEDRWGMVGKVGDPFREDCLLAAPCYKCHRQPLVIAERNWDATNNDDSQQYQILVACTHCGAVDEFTVNQGREGVLSQLKHSHQRVSVNDVKAESQEGGK
jgi:hypothetical protein